MSLRSLSVTMTCIDASPELAGWSAVCQQGGRTFGLDKERLENPPEQLVDERPGRRRSATLGPLGPSREEVGELRQVVAEWCCVTDAVRDLAFVATHRALLTKRALEAITRCRG